MYELGKIKSKYIILDILGFSDCIQFASDLLLRSSRTLRRLLQYNYSIAKNYLTSLDSLTISASSQTT